MKNLYFLHIFKKKHRNIPVFFPGFSFRRLKYRFFIFKIQIKSFRIFVKPLKTINVQNVVKYKKILYKEFID